MVSSRTKIGFTAILLLCAWIGSTGIYAHSEAETKPQPPATILLIRHAEKLPDGQSDLSSEGFERARRLAQAFSGAGARPDLPTPQALFSAHVSAHSNRPTQTIAPLAEALHLQINDQFRDRDYAGLAAELLGAIGARYLLHIRENHPDAEKDHGGYERNAVHKAVVQTAKDREYTSQGVIPSSQRNWFPELLCEKRLGGECCPPSVRNYDQTGLASTVAVRLPAFGRGQRWVCSQCRGQHTLADIPVAGFQIGHAEMIFPQRSALFGHCGF